MIVEVEDIICSNFTNAFSAFSSFDTVYLNSKGFIAFGGLIMVYWVDVYSCTLLLSDMRV